MSKQIKTINIKGLDWIRQSNVKCINCNNNDIHLSHDMFYNDIKISCNCYKCGVYWTITNKLPKNTITLTHPGYDWISETSKICPFCHTKNGKCITDIMENNGKIQQARIICDQCNCIWQVREKIEN